MPYKSYESKLKRAASGSGSFKHYGDYNAFVNRAGSLAELQAMTARLQGLILLTQGPGAPELQAAANLQAQKAEILKEHNLTDDSELTAEVEAQINLVTEESVRAAFAQPAAQPGPSLDRCGFKDCNIAANLKRCTKCWQIAYCGQDHQRQDWPRHKVECLTPRG